jgi:DNA repair protein RAD50
MSYHAMKMEEINKIMKELWQSTYRGTDIETIKIKAEEQDQTSSSKVRKFKYQVLYSDG